VEAPWPVRWREATGKISDFVRSGRSAQTATQPAGCGGNRNLKFKGKIQNEKVKMKKRLTVIANSKTQLSFI
jgi:hypothetical protein